MHGRTKVPFKARWRNAGVVTRPRSTATPGSAVAADEISAGGDDDVVDKILKEWGLSSVRKCREESEGALQQVRQTVNVCF